MREIRERLWSRRLSVRLPACIRLYVSAGRALASKPSTTHAHTLTRTHTPESTVSTSKKRAEETRI